MTDYTLIYKQSDYPIEDYTPLGLHKVLQPYYKPLNSAKDRPQATREPKESINPYLWLVGR